MSDFRRVLLVIVSVVMAMVLIAGCGGDDAPAAGDPAASPAPSTTATPVPAPEGIPGVVLERAPGRLHTNADVNYPGPEPPSGGDHSPVWAPCGYYDQQVRDENGVHSLEHGAVWIAFAPPPATSEADIAVIKNLVASHPKVLASPYEGLNKPVVLVAWERRLEVDSIHDPRVAQFIETYAGSQNAPEPNAGC